MQHEQLMTDLLYAYYDARQHKRNTINQLRFEQHFESELFALCDEIVGRTYQPRKSICFIVNEPVKREIFAADFRDRVVHHFLYRYINPVFESHFIDDSYSCRKEKGTLYGINRVAEFIKKCSANYTKDCYILKLDIRGYFMNINKTILKKQVFALLENREAYYAENGLPQPDWAVVDYLLNVVIDNNPLENCFIKGQKSDWDGLPPSKSLFHSAENCGLPIGNLTSQVFSNVYLHSFDKFMKNDLQLQYYGRYVDDFVVIDFVR
jgi:hypothetical protein